MSDEFEICMDWSHRWRSEDVSSEGEGVVVNFESLNEGIEDVMLRVLRRVSELASMVGRAGGSLEVSSVSVRRSYVILPDSVDRGQVSLKYVIFEEEEG